MMFLLFDKIDYPGIQIIHSSFNVNFVIVDHFFEQRATVAFLIFLLFAKGQYVF